MLKINATLITVTSLIALGTVALALPLDVLGTRAINQGNSVSHQPRRTPPGLMIEKRDPPHFAADADASSHASGSLDQDSLLGHGDATQMDTDSHANIALTSADERHKTGLDMGSGSVTGTVASAVNSGPSVVSGAGGAVAGATSKAATAAGKLAGDRGHAGLFAGLESSKASSLTSGADKHGLGLAAPGSNAPIAGAQSSAEGANVAGPTSKTADAAGDLVGSVSALEHDGLSAIPEVGTRLAANAKAADHVGIGASLASATPIDTLQGRRPPTAVAQADAQADASVSGQASGSATSSGHSTSEHVRRM